MRRRRCPTWSFLTCEGGRPSGPSVTREGRVRALPAGEHACELTIGAFGPGECLAEHGPVDERPWFPKCRHPERSGGRRVIPEAFNIAVGLCPRVAPSLARALAGCLGLPQIRLKSFPFMDAAQRVGNAVPDTAPAGHCQLMVSKRPTHQKLVNVGGLSGT